MWVARYSSKRMPPGPSSPASMPSTRKTSSSGAPTRYAQALSSTAATNSRAPMKISWFASCTGPLRESASIESERDQGHQHGGRREVAQCRMPGVRQRPRQATVAERFVTRQHPAGEQRHEYTDHRQEQVGGEKVHRL